MILIFLSRNIATE